MIQFIPLYTDENHKIFHFPNKSAQLQIFIKKGRKASAKNFSFIRFIKNNKKNSAQLRISLMSNKVRHYLKLRSEPRGIFAHFCCWLTKVGRGSGRSARNKTKVIQQKLNKIYEEKFFNNKKDHYMETCGGPLNLGIPRDGHSLSHIWEL